MVTWLGGVQAPPIHAPHLPKPAQHVQAAENVYLEASLDLRKTPLPVGRDSPNTLTKALASR